MIVTFSVVSISLSVMGRTSRFALDDSLPMTIELPLTSTSVVVELVIRAARGAAAGREVDRQRAAVGPLRPRRDDAACWAPSSLAEASVVAALTVGLIRT